MPTGGASHQMTSHLVQPTTSIRREGSPSSFSGHGCSTNGNMLRNPFCFVLQVTAILIGSALTPPGCSAEPASADQIAGAGIRLSSSDYHLVSNTSLFLVQKYAWMPTGGASHQITSQLVQPTTSMRREEAPSSFSGHGCSTNGNMSKNPFCFVLQTIFRMITSQLLLTSVRIFAGAPSGCALPCFAVASGCYHLSLVNSRPGMTVPPGEQWLPEAKALWTATSSSTSTTPLHIKAHPPPATAPWAL
ncbi:uncharacterized protein LOC142776530 [Rhipicephalus microplus]|uniref:uncharacterized protein LOC142776530 n=1 Tax=Rhipicephalus microplus TaxID=6941 RepID=UPI003F6A81CA